jgi:transcriptional regulator with XRE-family HTH domain
VAAVDRFAANLRRARRERGLSQEALAETSAMHRTEISLLERGRREPRLETIVRLARALGVPVGDLLAGTDDAG